MQPGETLAHQAPPSPIAPGLQLRFADQGALYFGGVWMVIADADDSERFLGASGGIEVHF